MALRRILVEGDESLRKKSREVSEITPRIRELLDDMVETMRDSEGVGLAAPQVGVLRRIAVVELDDVLYELINPEIVHAEGEEEAYEACLSVPGYQGMVKRPAKVVVSAKDREGQIREYEGEGLLAVAFCHEIDHLDGILYIDKATDIHVPEESEGEDGEAVQQRQGGKRRAGEGEGN